MEKMIALGFAPWQIAHFDDKSIEYIVQHAGWILELFIVDTVTRILSYPQGLHAIKFISMHRDELKSEKYDYVTGPELEQIIGNGNPRNLRDFFDNFAELRDKFHLSKQEIISIICGGNGNNNIKYFIRHYQAISEAGFSKEQIVQLISRKVGMLKLNATLPVLLRKLHVLGFDSEQIVEFSERRFGCCNLQAVIDNFAALQKLGLSHKEILNLSGHRRGSYALEIVAQAKYLDTLVGNGVNIHNIVILGDCDNGASRIMETCEVLPDLRRLGFTVEQCLAMIMSNRGIAKVRKMLLNYAALRAHGMDNKVITHIIMAAYSPVQLDHLVHEKTKSSNAAQLSLTQLSSTQLSSTQLSSTQLSSTQLSSTQLSSTQLSSTQLSSTQLSSTQLSSTQLSSTQLSSMQLSSVQHGDSSMQHGAGNYTHAEISNDDLDREIVELLLAPEDSGAPLLFSAQSQYTSSSASYSSKPSVSTKSELVYEHDEDNEESFTFPTP